MHRHPDSSEFLAPLYTDTAVRRHDTPMSDSINTVVVGAGVIGLACARALALHGREVLVIERNDGIGQETSSRNSEVIHGGLYYAPGSLKAKLCVAGKQALYEYCESKVIPHRHTGKLIVATRPEDAERLERIAERARQNGVVDLEWLDEQSIHSIEPAINAAAALLSPSTGIIDVHALMHALQADLEAAGGYVALQSRLTGATRTHAGLQLDIDSLGERTSLLAENVVNCAGLHASNVAEMLRGESADIPPTRYARGVYFEYAGPSPFQHLIYPMPEPGGLGVHATLDMAGALRFGPDVEWIRTIDYSVDPARGAAFASSIRHWWSAVDPERLRPAYAGIRPKLTGPDAPPADFRITRTEYGNGDVVDLLGIESPGLTSALTIADHVCALLR
ncbi:MAG: NAD(P)/FAD-dependent oxidoreductase [Gammaproteobacteria bacterium]